MDCLFCKIAAKEIPADIVLEDEHFVAFRDIHPKAPVHVLIIPRQHAPDLAKVEGDGLSGLPAFVGRLAALLGIEETGYRIIANTGRDAGQIIFHVHFHLLAGRDLGDLV